MKFKRCLLVIAVLFLAFVPQMGFATAYAKSYNFHETVPAFGLYCEREGAVKSGRVRFSVSDPKSGRADCFAEYELNTVSESARFFLPFVSSADNVPEAEIKVNGERVNAEVAYGESFLGGFVPEWYSPDLMGAEGTLYTLESGENTVVEFETQSGQCFIYDFSNQVNYVQSGTRHKFTYAGAVGAKYTLFVAGAEPEFFESSVEFKKERKTCLAYVETVCGELKEMYAEGAEDFFAAQLNGLIKKRTNARFSDFFISDYFSARVNAFRFDVSPQEGNITAEITMPAAVAVDTVYTPYLYKLEYVSTSSAPVEFTFVFKEDFKHVIESSVNLSLQSGGVYSASSSNGFTCIFSSSDNPQNPFDKKGGGIGKAALAAIIVAAALVLAGACAAAVLIVRRKRDKRG